MAKFTLLLTTCMKHLEENQVRIEVERVTQRPSCWVMRLREGGPAF